MNLDTTYRLGIMLSATQFALHEERNREKAQRLFAEARDIRRQLQEA